MVIKPATVLKQQAPVNHSTIYLNSTAQHYLLSYARFYMCQASNNKRKEKNPSNMFLQHAMSITRHSAGPVAVSHAGPTLRRQWWRFRRGWWWLWHGLRRGSNFTYTSYAPSTEVSERSQQASLWYTKIQIMPWQNPVWLMSVLHTQAQYSSLAHTDEVYLVTLRFLMHKPKYPIQHNRLSMQLFLRTVAAWITPRMRQPYKCSLPFRIIGETWKKDVAFPSLPYMAHTFQLTVPEGVLFQHDSFQALAAGLLLTSK